MSEKLGGSESLVSREVIQHFVKRSGLAAEEITTRLGEVVSDFPLSPREVIEKYFPDQVESPDVGRSLENGYRRYVDDHGRQSDSWEQVRGIFWRDLLVNLLHQPSWRERHYEDWYPVVAENGWVSAQDAIAGWQGSEVPEVVTSIREHAPDGYALLLRSLEEGETLESRLSMAQEGMRRVLQIGTEMVERGKLPITRMMFFRSAGDKQAYCKAMDGQTKYRSRNPNLGADTLKEIEFHTQAPNENTPLSSWTYLPISEPWRYGLDHLGRSQALMLVAELDWSQAIWARNLTEGSTWRYPEEWRWYEKLDLKAKAMDERVKIHELASEGYAAALVPTEGEVVTWGDLPLKGMVDLGPH